MGVFELDVFVGNAFIIDWQIFELWLSGFDCEKAVENLQRVGALQNGFDGCRLESATVDMLYSDVQHHYSGLATLQRLLESPLQLQQQCSLQISPRDRVLALQRYYDLDDSVARELVGKKPSSKQRKDLDDVAEKTNVPVRSCRRQFDNIRRIYKVVDDMSGELMDNIKQHFLLPDRLARRYAVILFLSWTRIEMHKRKLAHLTFDDLFVCGDSLLVHWADPQAEIDREFLLQLRELKSLLDCEKEAKNVVLKKLSIDGSVSTDCRGDLQLNFRSLYRSTVGIAVSLHHSRDLKDFFIDIEVSPMLPDIQERVVEPCRSARWSVTDMRRVVAAFEFTASELLPFRREEDLHGLWQRYWRVASVCIENFFGS